MPLSPGARLGPYEITASLGAGGMGEVYRARDTRLGRDVAVKVLPPDLAKHPNARERFEREARLVSGLNHKNICTLHDVGREGDTDYIVMELLEGESLAARLERGPLRLDEALRAGAEIASALDAAHRAGVVHRDLKPGNVMLTRGGTKVLDFGIAKLAESGDGRPGHLPTMAPTRTTPLTASGALVGTLNYMAPEQLEGKPVDHRADIFAFGTVLYEMITGRRAFDGGSQASVIAAILEREPAPCASIVPMTPAALDRLVRDCLAKDPDERRQSAHDLARELAGIAQSPAAPLPSASPVAPASRAPLVLAWGIAAAAVIALIATWGIARRDASAAPQPRVAFEILAASPGDLESQPVVVSPDGRALLYGTSSSLGGARKLFVRKLDDPTPHEIPGALMANRPFWSADGREVAYTSDDKLMAVTLDGGHPRVICETSYGVGGTWSPTGTIVFSPSFYQGLRRVDAAGGAPQPVTTLDAARHETGHLWPAFLPDGRHLLFVSRTIALESNRIEMVDVQGGPRKVVVEADALVGYSAPWLVFAKGSVIFAQRFDPGSGTVSGDRQRLTDDGYYDEDIGSAWASVSVDTLAWRPHRPSRVAATWVDERGVATPAFDENDASGLRLSPDGSQVAMTKYDADAGGPAIWVRDLTRQVTSRLTTGAGSAFLGAWTPDGRQILFSTDAQGPYVITSIAVDGSAEPKQVLREDGADWWVTSVTTDGKSALGFRERGGVDRELWIFSIEDPKKRGRLMSAGGWLNSSALSPDATAVAFTSNRTGRWEVYARRIDAGAITQISTAGATSAGPRWTRDGRAIWYVGTDGAIHRVDVRIEGLRIVADPPSARIDGTGLVSFDTAPGGRLLVLRDASASPNAFVVRSGWKSGLR